MFCSHKYIVTVSSNCGEDILHFITQTLHNNVMLLRCSKKPYVYFFPPFFYMEKKTLEKTNNK